MVVLDLKVFLLTLTHTKFLFQIQSTFSCAQRHIDFCDRLAEQAQFDSNAAIRGIRDALAVFLGKETSIPYDKGIDSVTKVKEQLNGLGLNNAREQKMFASTDGRTLKRVPLTKILNKYANLFLTFRPFNFKFGSYVKLIKH